MEILQGIPASPGIASAPAFLLEGGDFCVPRRQIPEEARAGEIERLRRAFDDGAAQLEAIRARVQGPTADVDGVLGAHLAILRDPALCGEAERLVKEKLWTPEWALSSVLDGHAEALLKTGDEYLAHRVADLRDIKHRILRVLLGQREEELARLEGPVIIVARDLTPSQTASLDRRKVGAIVTEGGGRTSHTAIIARSFGIPAVVGVAGATSRVAAGTTVAVDGSRGPPCGASRSSRRATPSAAPRWAACAGFPRRPGTATGSGSWRTSRSPRRSPPPSTPAPRASGCSGRSSSSGPGRTSPRRPTTSGSTGRPSPSSPAAPSSCAPTTSGRTR